MIQKIGWREKDVQSNDKSIAGSRFSTARDPFNLVRLTYVFRNCTSRLKVSACFHNKTKLNLNMIS